MSLTRRETTMLKSVPRLAGILSLLIATGAHAKESPGQILFNNHCRTCHSIKPGDNRLGPSLHSIYGAGAGQVTGFLGYSGGLHGFIWTDTTLDRFIGDPSSVLPSTYMIYPPVTSEKERHLIIEYLKSLSESK